MTLVPRFDLLILALFPAVAADAADAPRAELTFRRAEELVAADRPGDAEPLYLDAVRTAEPYTRRQSYLKLINLYLNSGRPDKGVRLSAEFRTWLRDVRDGPGEAELDVLVGECYAGLGHAETADRYFLAAVRPGTGVSAAGRLAALSGRAELAEWRRDGAAAPRRWKDLEDAARAAAADAKRSGEVAARLKATRYLADALRHQGDTAAALAILAPLPDLHDQLRDPIGRRDTQRQRANLLAAGGRMAAAAPLFREALELHRRYRPARRMAAGEILAEWAAAAAAAGQRDEAARLRGEAEGAFLEILRRPAGVDALDGGTLAAFVRLQLLTRSARQFRKALDLSRGPGDRWVADALLEVRVKTDRGELEVVAAAYRSAREQLARVRDMAAAFDPPDLRLLPQVLVNLAVAELAGESPDRAEPHLTECAGLYARHHIPPDPVLAECDYLRGAAAAQRGEFPAAMGHFRRGLGVCEAVGRPAEPARFNLLLSSALIHKDQGDFPAAADALSKAAESLAVFADPDDVSFGLIAAARADLHISRGRITPAVALAAEMEAACRRHDLRGGYIWGTARHVRALDLFERNQVPQAEAVWAELARSQRAERHVLLGRTLNHLGLAAEAQGRDDEARQQYEEARRFLSARPWAPAVTRAITLWRLAVQRDKLGQRDEAKRLLGEVFDVADRARLGTLGEAGQRAEFFSQFRPAFELLARWQARDDDGEGLARTITRSRSRTLLDQVLAAGVDPRENLRGPNRDRLLAREARARANVSRLRARAFFALPGDRATEPAAEVLLGELEAAQQEFATAWRDIVDEDPVARVLAAPARGTASPLPAGLGARTAVLAYMVGRDESFAVLYPSPKARPQVYRLAVPADIPGAVGDLPPAEVVVANGRRGFTVGTAPRQPERPAGPAARVATALTGAVAGRLTDHYLWQISDPAFVPTRALLVTPRVPGQPPLPAVPELLGDAILPAELRDRLRAAAADHLVVVPDGPLHKLPLECVLVSAGAGPRYAIDELPPVSYAPSLGVLDAVMARPRSAAPATLLTVGDPAYPAADPGGRRALPRLPNTETECRRVAAAFPPDRVTALKGEAATERNVTAAIPGKQFVHLAAHGFADERFGNLFAAVALTPPAEVVTPDDDGFLSLHEIHRLRMGGCELAVLSACVTNVGPQRPMEAGVTLAGAFLSAGARRVIATCWSVSDRAAADLVATFFDAAGPRNPSPVGYATALKAARLKIRGTPGWEAPFFWAPFVFAGAPD